MPFIIVLWFTCRQVIGCDASIWVQPRSKIGGILLLVAQVIPIGGTVICIWAEVHLIIFVASYLPMHSEEKHTNVWTCSCGATSCSYIVEISDLCWFLFHFTAFCVRTFNCVWSFPWVLLNYCRKATPTFCTNSYCRWFKRNYWGISKFMGIPTSIVGAIDGSHIPITIKAYIQSIRLLQ